MPSTKGAGFRARQQAFRDMIRRRPAAISTSHKESQEQSQPVTWPHAAGIDVRDGLMLSQSEWEVARQTRNRTADLPLGQAADATGRSMLQARPPVAERAPNRRRKPASSCEKPVGFMRGPASGLEVFRIRSALGLATDASVGRKAARCRRCHSSVRLTNWNLQCGERAMSQQRLCEFVQHAKFEDEALCLAERSKQADGHRGNYVINCSRIWCGHFNTS